MARYIDAEKLIEYIDKNVVCTSDDSEECKQFMLEHLAMEWFAPTVDVAPRAEVEKLQECIYDLYAMLDGIIYHARNNDLSALRPFRGASGCDAYQGAPLICRKFDKVFDKHEEAISMAVKFADLKKKYTERSGE